MSRLTANWATSSTPSRSIAAKENPVPAVTAAAPCAASCRPAAPPSSVRNDSVREQRMTEAPSYQNILIERRGAVGVVTLNRPAALNALNATLMAELTSALDGLEADAAVGAIVLTGNEKAFAAGADVKEMVSKTYPEIY